MKLSILSAGAARFLLPICFSATAAADVIYVAAGGNGQYTTIQSAIDAAIDGDILLVRSGSYAGFTVDNRRLWIVADVGAEPSVTSTVTVRNTASNNAVLVSGLTLQGVSGLSAQNGMKIENNAGHVRVQDCSGRGGDGHYTHQGTPGGHGASVLDSNRVELVGCSMTGGNGGGIPLFVSPGGKGGDGVLSQNSSIAFYDCQLKGGVGGEADYVTAWDRAGDGGDGCRVNGFGILASGSAFQGGMGGGYATIPGNGGAGARVDDGQVQYVGSSFAGGMGGVGYSGNHGTNGQGQAGTGVFNMFSGSARKISAQAIAAENGTLQFTLTGEPGDRFWLLRSALPNFVYAPAKAGVLLISPLALSGSRPHVTLPGSGTATVDVSVPDVGVGTPALFQYWQCWVVSASGQVRLGTALHVAVLNCSDLLPDCNADGSCDTCDLLLLGVSDCDVNGVPDFCQGDCNSNGVLDPCDVLNGTSLDQNHNWIPDECELQTTWQVNASAAPGGNGSISAPFQALAPAFAAAISGDTILVANGLYQGSANRDLDFAGRNLLVQSMGGAVNCIIDCQLQSRAFAVTGGTTSAARIQGFTLRNGKVVYPARFGAGIYIYLSSATVRSCVFENNDAQEGGGLMVRESSASIESCNFVNNKATIGGGAFVLSSPDVRFLACSFRNNQAPGGQGGGTYLQQSSVKLQHCSFLSNTAPPGGGGVYALWGDVHLDQCLLAGNSAGAGGAIISRYTIWTMTGCTIVGNTATNTAAAVLHSQSSGSTTRVWRNNIVWNNTAPNGTPIRLETGSLDIDWCDIQGGQASVTLVSGTTLNWGAGNFAQDPLFVDPDGADNNPLTVIDNDYRLALGSPCLDAGENASVVPDWFDLDGDGNVTEPVPFDFDGNARFVEIPSAPNTGSGIPPLVDLGAWERP